MLKDNKIVKPVIIMIANQKGGVGKTTIALELINAFGRKGYKALGIDLDPQASFGRLSGAKTKDAYTIKTLLDYKFGKIVPLNEVIQKLENFDMIVGDEGLSEADSLYGGDMDAFLLSDMLSAIKGYDFIIMDSAPGRSKLMYMEYLSADYVLIPTEPDTESNVGIYKVYADIQAYSKHNMCHAKILGILMNRYKANTKIHKTMYNHLAKIGKEINTYPFYTTIPETVKAAEARAAKKTLTDYVPKSQITKCFESVVDEIIGRIGDVK